jgi:hypothetical protein
MMRNPLGKFSIALLCWCSTCPALAATPSIIAPWQPLTGGYNGTLRNGRLLAYPPTAPEDAPFFFSLVENAVLTMTGDNDGWTRSAVAVDPAVATPQQPNLGDWWEHSNGGRGFTSSFCGGYTEGGCGTSFGTNPLGIILGGPPSVMDGGNNSYSPNDVASTGWPAALSGFAQLLLRLGNPDMCIAPPGAPDAQLHLCAAGLAFRSGGSSLYVSPDAGSQWYPLSSSCGIPFAYGPSLVAADAGQPGHVVTFSDLDASGCSLPGTNSCSWRQIAWTGDVSVQVAATISATATKEASASAPFDVDQAGLPGSDDAKLNPEGWRYAALGHLALDAPGKTCDVVHAGIQAGCNAESSKMCHTVEPQNVQGTSPNLPHERFCPKTSQPECSCGYTGDLGPATVATETCAFPTVTSLAIDPRNGQVYAPSVSAVPDGFDAKGKQKWKQISTGLLFSPDGGRKWRRHGHSSLLQVGDTPGANSIAFGDGFAATAEPWPYGDADPDDADPLTPPNWQNDPGVHILTLQGLSSSELFAGIVASIVNYYTDVPLQLDLNAQPAALRDISRVSFASTPCPPAPEGTAEKFTDVMGFQRTRLQVTAVLTATWQNPLAPHQPLSGVFIAHGDSCTDAAAKKPLVFRDTGSLMPEPMAKHLAGA